MNRRKALITIGLTAINGVAWSLSKPLRLLQSAATVGQPPPPASTESELAVDARLRKDLARLRPRVYSEEGIPMFLGCENLVPRKNPQIPAKVALTPLNTALASELRQSAEAWKRMQPDAQAKDVAPLIEVLADRDFTNGRIEGQA